MRKATFNFTGIKFVIVFLFFTFGCRKNNSETICNNVIPAGTYIYPLRPGMEGWKNLTTHQQMIDTCQIPQRELTVMSTEALVQSCLDFPLWGDLFFFINGNLKGALNNYNETLFAMKELMKRQDAGSAVMLRYERMYPECVKKYSGYEKAKFVYQFFAFELIMSQNDILLKINKQDRKTLVKLALQSYKSKMLHSEQGNFLIWDLGTPLYLCTRIMLLEEYPLFTQNMSLNNNLQKFCNEIWWPEDINDIKSMYEIISQIAEEFG